MTSSQHVDEIRLRKDHRGVDLISDAFPFARLWHAERSAVSNAIDSVKFRSRPHDAVIRVYEEAGNAIRNAGAQRRFQSMVSVDRVKQKAATR